MNARILEEENLRHLQYCWYPWTWIL